MATILQLIEPFKYVQFLAFSILIFGILFVSTQFFKEQKQIVLALGAMTLIYLYGIVIRVFTF